MKVLVFSSTPWNTDNSFGSSYSSIFEGIDNIEFVNIYCTPGFPKNKINAKYFQITEKNLLKNLFNKNIKTGVEVSPDINFEELNEKETQLINSIKKKRWRVFFWLRRFLWRISRWKSIELKNFILKYKPDIIFVPLYHSTYLNRIILFIKEFTGLKMVGYVSDDIYSLKQFSLSPFYWIDRLITRIQIKKTVDKCEYIYVISDIQKNEYEKIFNKECRILTKGANFDKPDYKKHNNKPLKMVYTGNIGGGRWKSLATLGRVLAVINKNDIKMQLYIYSMTPLTRVMERALNIENIVFFMGGIPSEQVPAIQEDADILVHVEPTDLKGKLLVRHSFSTKIVDYFRAARAVFAIGWPKAASIDYLIQNDAALVAFDQKSITEQLQKIVNNMEILSEYAQKAWECGKRNHQINEIQKNLYNDLQALISKKK